MFYIGLCLRQENTQVIKLLLLQCPDLNCGQILLNESEFNAHVETHSFTCSDCGLPCAKYQHLLDHRDTSHPLDKHSDGEYTPFDLSAQFNLQETNQYNDYDDKADDGNDFFNGSRCHTQEDEDSWELKNNKEKSRMLPNFLTSNSDAETLPLSFGVQENLPLSDLQKKKAELDGSISMNITMRLAQNIPSDDDNENDNQQMHIQNIPIDDDDNNNDIQHMKEEEDILPVHFLKKDNDIE